MEDDDMYEFKNRVSSGFDRLVAFATEMNKSRDVSPKLEQGPPPQMMYSEYMHHMKKDETRKMKSDKPRDYPADLSNERRIRMMMEEQSRKSNQ